MTLNQRIKLLRKTLAQSQTEFATSIGITQTSLSQIESGKNGISYDVFHAIISTYNVNPFWLMDGQGEMLGKPQSAPPKGGGLPLVITVGDDGEENIILVEQKAAAGYLQGMQDSTYVSKLPAFRLPGFRGRTYRAFEVSGDSMLPTIFPKDILVCNYIESFSDVRDNYVHIIVMNDGSIVAKRVINNADKEQHLILQSDNTNYPPYRVELADVAQIWRVHARITAQLAAPDREQQRLSDIEQRIIQIEESMKKK